MPPKGATGSASPGAAANDEDETSDVEIEFELPQGKVEEFLNQLQADKSDLKAAFPLAASAVIKAVEEDGKPVPAVLKDLPEAPADVVAKFDAVSRLSRLKELQNRYAGLNAQRERAEGMKRVLDRVPAAGEAEGSLGPPLGTTNMPLVPGLGAPDEAPPAFPPPGGLPFPYRGVPGVLPSKVREPPKPPADPTMGEELIDAPDPRLPPEAEDEPDSKLPEAKMVLLKDGLDMSFQHLRTHGQRMAATVRELSRQLEEGAELAEVMDLQADPDIVEEYVRNQRLIYEQQRVMDEADWDRRIEKERQFWVERDGRTVELRRFYGDDIRGKPDELGGPGAAGSLLAAAAAAAGGGGAEPALPQFGGGGGGAASGPSSPARGFDTRSPEGIRRHDFSACTRGDHGAFGYVNGEASGPGSPSSRYEEDLPPSLSYRRALRRVGNDGEWPGPEEIENVRGQDSYAYGQWEESGIGYAESESYHSELTAPGIEGGAFFAGFAERSAGSAQQQRLEALRRSKSAPRAFRTAQAPQEQDAPPFAAFNGYGTAPRRSASQHRGAASPRSAAAAAPSLSPRSLPKQRSAAPYAAEISQWERPPFAAFAGEQGTPPRARRGGTGSLGGTPSPGTGGHTPRSGGGPGAGSRRPQRPGSGTSTPGRGGSTGRNSFLFGVKPGPASSVGEEKTRLSTTRESAEDTEEGEEEEEEVGFLATLASAAGLGEGSEANGPPVSKAAKKRMKELDPKSRYVVGACLDSNLPLKPPDLKSIRAAAGHGVEVRFQRIVEVRHEGRMGDPSVAQLALDYSAALAQHGEEIAKAGDTTRHVSLVVDLLTFYPLSVQLHLWALEAMMALYNASEGGEAGADGLSNPIFDAVAEIVEIHEGDKGLGASCPELGNRLLAAMALVITPANRTRMENLHVDFVLRLTSFPDAGAGVMEHGLQVLIVSRSQHRLKEQLKFAQSTLAAFRAEPKLVTRVLLAMHAIWEVSCEGPYRLLMDVTGAAPLGGHTVSGMREVCRVMDLYAQDRKVQGAGCFALRAAVKVADKSREVTFRKLIEDGLLRAVNYAQMNFRSSRSVAVNMCTITLAVARKMSKLMNIETALQVIDAGSSHVRDAEVVALSLDAVNALAPRLRELTTAQGADARLQQHATRLVQMAEHHYANVKVVGPLLVIIATASSDGTGRDAGGASGAMWRKAFAKAAAMAVPIRALYYHQEDPEIVCASGIAARILSFGSVASCGHAGRLKAAGALLAAMQKHSNRPDTVRELLAALANVGSDEAVRQGYLEGLPDTEEVIYLVMLKAASFDPDIFAQGCRALGALSSPEQVEKGSWDWKKIQEAAQKIAERELQQRGVALMTRTAYGDMTENPVLTKRVQKLQQLANQLLAGVIANGSQIGRVLGEDGEPTLESLPRRGPGRPAPPGRQGTDYYAQAVAA